MSVSYKHKKRETLFVTRDTNALDMEVLGYAVYTRPPSTHFPEAGELYVVSRDKRKKRTHLTPAG